MSRRPKQRGKSRPDFMVTGPRVQIEKRFDFVDE